MKKKKSMAIGMFVGIFLLLATWTIWGNTALELNTYEIASEKLPKTFNGYRIAHVSDVHNVEMGEENEKILTMLREAEPDIIAITGDLIDSRNTNVEIALQMIEEAVKIAPCYYVTGNHEARVSEYEELREGLRKLGVAVLEDETLKIEHSGENIELLGVNDPSFQTDYLFGNEEEVMQSNLQEMMKEVDTSTYTILLSHRPELFEIYVENNIDLVLSGHAHGGQFRLPLVGGLVAPNQGLFPKYDAGIYNKENTNMIVSKGIGNSIIPLRFNNRPEVILIELQAIR